MSTTAQRVITALVRYGMRHLFTDIEDNGCNRGEVVLWPDGHPVHSVKDALAYARYVHSTADCDIPCNATIRRSL